MPNREDETYRNLRINHVPTCTCVDCERRRNGLPARTKLPEHIEGTDEDWQAFFDDIAETKAPAPTPSKSAVRMEAQHRGIPLEIPERRRRMQDDEREERMERERKAGTRPQPKIPSPKKTEYSTKRSESDRTLATGTLGSGSSFRHCRGDRNHRRIRQRVNSATSTQKPFPNTNSKGVIFVYVELSGLAQNAGL